MLALANEYQMGKLKTACEHHMLRSLQKVKRPFYCTEYNIFLRSFKLAQQCRLNDVIHFLTPLLAKISVRDLEKCKNYDPTVLQPVYLARVKILESEAGKSKRWTLSRNYTSYFMLKAIFCTFSHRFLGHVRGTFVTAQNICARRRQIPGCCIRIITVVEYDFRCAISG